MEKLMYTPQQAAELLSLGKSTIHKLIASGDIPTVRVGRARRITRTALLDFIERSAAGGA